MRGLGRLDILFAAQLKAGEISLKDINLETKKVYVVVDENKNILFICSFSSLPKKEGKSGKKKIYAIPAGSTKIFVTSATPPIKNPRSKRKSNFKIKIC